MPQKCQKQAADKRNGVTITISINLDHSKFWSSQTPMYQPTSTVELGYQVDEI